MKNKLPIGRLTACCALLILLISGCGDSGSGGSAPPPFGGGSNGELEFVSIDLKIFAQASQTEQQPNIEVQAGQEIELSIVLSHHGTGQIDFIEIKSYRSTDAIISTSDIPEEAVSVFSLSPGDSREVSSIITVSSSAGTYYYGVCIEGSGCTSGIRVVVPSDKLSGESTPDLFLDVSDRTPFAGQEIALSVRASAGERKHQSGKYSLLPFYK